MASWQVVDLSAGPSPVTSPSWEVAQLSVTATATSTSSTAWQVVQLSATAGQATGAAWQVVQLSAVATSTLPVTPTNWWAMGLSVLIGAATAPTSPANAGPDLPLVEPGSLITLTGTVGDVSGSWVQTSGTTLTLTGSGRVRQYTAPATLAGFRATFRYTADNGTTDFVNHTILAVTERAVIGGVEVPAYFWTGPDYTSSTSVSGYTSTYGATYQ